MGCKVVIGGCRYFEDYEVFCDFVTACLENVQAGEAVTILSGHCAGVDQMAERYAQQQGLALEIFSADWSRYGRAAGPKRNKEMAMQADMVIAFWDGRSKGTASLLQYAQKLGKKTENIENPKVQLRAFDYFIILNNS